MAVLVAACAPKHAEFARLEDQRADWEAMAQRGDVEAQLLLADSYCCGYEDMKHTVKAVNWYCAAAYNGSAVAALRLGDIFTHKVAGVDAGDVLENKAAAMAFYAQAAEGGVDTASARFDDLAFGMSKQELVTATAINGYADEACRLYDIPRGLKYKNAYDGVDFNKMKR